MTCGGPSIHRSGLMCSRPLHSAKKAWIFMCGAVSCCTGISVPVPSILSSARDGFSVSEGSPCVLRWQSNCGNGLLLKQEKIPAHGLLSLLTQTRILLVMRPALVLGGLAPV